jgi:hypothetical protein
VRVDAGLEAAIFYGPDDEFEEFERTPLGPFKQWLGRWLLRLLGPPPSA